MNFKYVYLKKINYICQLDDLFIRKIHTKSFLQAENLMRFIENGMIKTKNITLLGFKNEM